MTVVTIEEEPEFELVLDVGENVALMKESGSRTVEGLMVWFTDSTTLELSILKMLMSIFWSLLYVKHTH